MTMKYYEILPCKFRMASSNMENNSKCWPRYKKRESLRDLGGNDGRQGKPYGSSSKH